MTLVTRPYSAAVPAVTGPMEAIVTDGSFELVLPHDPRIYAYVRRLGGEEWLVLGNFSGEVVEPDLPGASSWELVLGDPPASGLTLQPWEGRVHRRSASA